MQITTEFILFWFAVVGPLFTGMLILSNKLEKIWEAINNKVSHETCQARRDRCPSIDDISEIKEKLKEVEHANK